MIIYNSPSKPDMMPFFGSEELLDKFLAYLPTSDSYLMSYIDADGKTVGLAWVDTSEDIPHVKFVSSKIEKVGTRLLRAAMDLAKRTGKNVIKLDVPKKKPLLLIQLIGLGWKPKLEYRYRYELEFTLSNLAN